jgi:hypothetical protein
MLGAVTADVFNIAGSLNNTGTLLGKITTGAPPTPDPLQTIPQPNLATATIQSTTPVSVTGTTTSLPPGVYQGGISVGNGGNLTLQPGIHIMDGGGFNVTGSGSVTGNQVMIYNTGGAAAGPIDLQGSGTMKLTPPTSGNYKGIAIFQDRLLTNGLTMVGNSNLQIGGAVYAPNAPLSVSGLLGFTPGEPGSALITSTLTVSGASKYQVNAGSNRPQVPDVRLVD